MTNKHQGYFLVFTSHFDRDRGLDQGRLILEHIDRGHQNIWKATSSHRRGQGKESFHNWGGMLPPAYRCPLVTQLRVNTTPINLAHVRGVDGNFYKISPYEMKTDKGGKRSDFGIHLDKNADGSLGCIVMSQKNFSDFQNTLTRLRSEGVSELPLVVGYS
ncbi:MAG: hypothetical protein AAGF26_14215 [Cyanobacteria bacterium P01_G01_bin.49]